MRISVSTIILTIVIVAFTATISYGQEQNIVSIYRWKIPSKTYITVAEDEYDSEVLKAKGWTDKTFLFYAYRKPIDQSVAVYGWYNKKTRTHISICEDEYTDELMRDNGYSDKYIQFYALSQSSNNTIPVYRWLYKKYHNWVTATDSGNTECIKNGFTNRTLQYYGLISNK